MAAWEAQDHAVLGSVSKPYALCHQHGWGLVGIEPTAFEHERRISRRPFSIPMRVDVCR